ncbi:KPN_01571 family protein [Escherichia fergusonii]|nr:KPN_01571 family protein [Escherichia fergusonii]
MASIHADSAMNPFIWVIFVLLALDAVRELAGEASILSFIVGFL